MSGGPARTGVLALVARPALCFAVLSLVFGALAIALTPPLRGPDENAHVLRALGIAVGEIVPSQADARGRKGLDLPPRLAADFAFFDAARAKAGTPGFTYRAVWDALAARPAPPAADAPPVFTPYGGSEGYSPVPYLPYVAAALAAKLLRLDFLPTLYVMRAAGLLAWTALAAYAIALAPRLGWAVVAIAMLPSALYGRAVVNADGAVLGTTLVVVVLCWRAALGAPGRNGTAAARGVWMALCALTKPPQVAFVLLAAMALPARALGRAWRSLLVVVLPALVLGPLWVVLASADIGVWRIAEAGGIPPEQFSPAWKLRFMVAHPGHFPRAALQSLDYAGELWLQLIGVLGWLDTRLQPFVYAVLSVGLIVACCEPPQRRDPDQRRIAAVAGLTALAYAAAVFLIFYLTYTPVDSDRVLGLQGRYFLVVLPLLAIVASGWLPALPAPVRASCAIAGAIVGGCAVLEAVLRTDRAPH